MREDRRDREHHRSVGVVNQTVRVREERWTLKTEVAAAPVATSLGAGSETQEGPDPQ